MNKAANLNEFIIFIDRVCPSIFLYLCCTIPCIYLLEVDLMEGRIEYKEKHDLKNCDFESSDIFHNSSTLSDIQGVRICSLFLPFFTIHKQYCHH